MPDHDATQGPPCRYCGESLDDHDTVGGCPLPCQAFHGGDCYEHEKGDENFHGYEPQIGRREP